MVKKCSRCLIEKPLSDFHYRKDSKKHRNQCKECWKYITAARRYGISFEQAKVFYQKSTCMCCGTKFQHRKHQHLHHVKHKVCGILCKYCNIALGQETEKDKHRIKSCLIFMSKPRKNLFDRVNQQGSRQTDPDPSTTTCSTQQRQCKMCKQILSLKNFYRQKYVSGKSGHYALCKECYKINVKIYKYGLTFEQIAFLRQQTQCDCCGVTIDPPYIHHIKDKVLGVVCRDCNLLLEQESSEIKSKLQSCYRWLEMI